MQYGSHTVLPFIASWVSTAKPGFSSSSIYFVYLGWPVPVEYDDNAQRTQAHTYSHTISHYKISIYISYVPVWICLGSIATTGGDVVKVFMSCNPTVYLLVIQRSEGKHILRLIPRLLSGWIHSFSKMPYGNNKRITSGLE